MQRSASSGYAGILYRGVETRHLYLHMNQRTKIRRKRLQYGRLARELLLVGRGLLDHTHPVLAFVIPIRRCNLSCTYCNEYDSVSEPVPTEEMLRRIDLLAAMGTSIITNSGGEPMLHPGLDDILARVHHHGIMAGLITNGFLITRERIEKFNEIGLDHVQISIDNVMPDEVSKKSLKTLDQKLELLAEYADFHVNINSVLGSGVRNPEDALTIAKRAIELGLSSTVGVIHDGTGQLVPLGEREHEIYREIQSLNKISYSRLNFVHQDNSAAGQPHDWRCRAGARYLYVCEDGLVHWCSQQRGYPGIPLEDYTPAMREHEYWRHKPCAPHCTIQCVQNTCLMDNWRNPQKETPPISYTPPKPVSELVQLGSEGQPAAKSASGD